VKIGLLRNLNKDTGKHNSYRHLIFYSVNNDRTLNIKLQLPLFFI
jgi:hypothetical protein